MPEAEGRMMVLAIRRWDHGKVGAEGVGVLCARIDYSSTLFGYCEENVVTDNSGENVLAEF